jgi:energy-coupling factor transporter transmembrane protein EcfT
MKNKMLADPSLNSSLPPIQPDEVSIPRLGKKFLYPKKCVVCNAPDFEGYKKHLSHSIKSGNTTSSLTMDLPLCQTCGAVRDEYKRNIGLGAAIAGVLAISVIVIYSLAASIIQKIPLSQTFASVFCISLIGFFVVWLISIQVLNLMLPQPVKERKKRIDDTAKMVYFDNAYINLRFQNSIFAEAFRSVNTLPTGEDLKKVMDQMTNPPPLPGAPPVKASQIFKSSANEPTGTVSKPPSVPSTEVLLKRRDRYNMPDNCVVCDCSSETQETLVAAASIQRDKVDEKLHVAFPLCKDCCEAQTEIRKNHAIAAAIAGVFAASFLAFLIYRIVMEGFGDSNVLGLLAGVALLFGLIYWPATALLKRRLSTEMRDRLKKRKNAAAITYFDSVFVRFNINNTNFAEKFREMNEVYSPPTVADYLRNT